MKEEEIDFVLIWKKVHGGLSESEEKQLEAWVGNDPRRVAFYQKVIRFYESGQLTTVKANSALEELKSKVRFIEPAPREYFHQWMYVAATFIFLSLAGLFIWRLSTFNQRAQHEVVAELSSHPGNVVLINSKGEQIELLKNEIVDVSDHQADVLSDGNRLEYKLKGDHIEDLSFNTLVIPRGESFSIRLSDGTKVWLNSESVLKYPSAFPEDLRELELTGEAYFEVTKDSLRPFVLRSSDQIISVLGTSFNVTAYQDEKEIITTLVEGSVSVEAKGGKVQFLLPNEQAVLSKKTGTLSKSQVDVSGYVSWVNGIFEFNDLPLELILQKLARWYDLQVFFENGSMKKRKFTGEIKRYEDIGQLLEMLETTGSVKFEVKGNAVLVK